MTRKQVERASDLYERIDQIHQAQKDLRASDPLFYISTGDENSVSLDRKQLVAFLQELTKQACAELQKLGAADWQKRRST